MKLAVHFLGSLLSNFFALYAMNFDLITCLRISVFISFVYFLMSKLHSQTNNGVYLENSIKVALQVAYLAFSLTLFVSFESAIFRFALIFLFPIILLLLRTINFCIQTTAHESWRNRSSSEIYLIAQTLVYWVLFFWGWKSFLFTALAFTFVIVLKRFFWSHKAGSVILFPVISTFIIFVGATLSRNAVWPYSTDYLLSYDQIFRGSIATGLTRWGLNNINFGYGHRLPYHWLGESITGLLARVGGISEIESISRISPYFGMFFIVIVCVTLLIALNASLQVAVAVVIFFASFNNHLDPTSIGTLWGAAMFMVSLLYVLTGLNEEYKYRSAILMSVLAAFTILCQSVLGYILAMSIIGLFILKTFTQSDKKLIYYRIISLLILVSVAIQLFFFRANSRFEENGIVGLNNWLKFPGLPIQIGGSPFSVLKAVQLNSLFYIFYVVAIFGVILFNIFRTDLLGTISKLFLFQLTAGFVLLNLINLGIFNSKFLAPIGLLGGFLGFLTIFQFFESVCRSRLGLTAICAVVVLSFVLQLNEVRVPLISAKEGLVYLFFIGISFVLVFFGVLNFRRDRINKSVSGVGLIIMMLSSTFFVLHNVESWRSSRVFLKRSSMQAMFGGDAIQECLQFVKVKTPNTSVIATSLWRIPGGVDEKYFLTSLMTNRLVILDGPVYSKMLDWQSLEYFEDLKDIHTSFANTLDRASHDQLVNLGASYFLLDTRSENPDRTWSSLVNENVVFGNQDCSVIKL